jgi:hypothetical protein
LGDFFFFFFVLFFGPPFIPILPPKPNPALTPPPTSRRPSRQEQLARHGISIEDDIDDESWQAAYVLSEVESALQSRVDELYLLVDYHRRALLERDTRLAALEHDLEATRERHLAAVDAERAKARESTEGIQRSLHRNELELKRLRVQGRWNIDLRAEVETLKRSIAQMTEAHAEGGWSFFFCFLFFFLIKNYKKKFF